MHMCKFPLAAQRGMNLPRLQFERRDVFHPACDIIFLRFPMPP